MMSRCRSVLTGLALAAFLAIPARAEELRELFHESFDTGKEVGVVGKAGPRLWVEGRDKMDLDRGTFAFFIKSPADPEIAEWTRLAGVQAQRANGYWGMVMRFERRLDEFLFTLYDTGNYSPPLRFQPSLGRWKAGEWHHLAAVWDRNEGVTIYEDGKRIASDWGQRRWEWSFVPAALFVDAPCDEVRVYAACLTDAQIAQLARGEKPTGAPIPVTPAPQRRAADLARMGWDAGTLATLPLLPSGETRQWNFARFLGCVDARRPVAHPFEGVVDSTWPLVKYGASIRGRELEIALAPGAAFDRIRMTLQRPFSGEVGFRAGDGRETRLAVVESTQPRVWHARLDAPVQRERLFLKRSTGRMNQLDFYRVDPLDAPPAGEPVLHFAAVDAHPPGEAGLALLGETPVRFRRPLAASRNAVPAWTLAAPEMGGFQALTPPPDEARAFDGARVTLVAEKLTEPTPVRIVVKEPVLSQRNWLVADALLQPRGSGRQVFTLVLKGRPVINLPPLRVPQRGKPALEQPGVPFGLMLTAANPVSWVMGDGGCSVAFLPADMAAALPAAAEDQVEFMRESYAEVMEGHLYRDKHIQTPLTWLAKFAPDHPRFRQMYERVDSPVLFEGIAVPKIEWKEPPNSTGAPDWAFWQMQALKEHLRIVHWYIDAMQVETGEYGGVWNDDTTHTENWIEYALGADDTGKIKASLRRFWDGLWFHQLEGGVGKYTQDCCHFYEEGMGSQAMRLMVDYGDPVVFARAMAASSHYDKWLRFAPDGRCVWLSEYVSVNGAWTQGTFGTKPGYGGHKWDILVPAGYLIWYNRHPAAAKYYLGLDNGHGFHGSAQDRLTGMEEARKRYAESLLKPRDARSDPRTLSTWLDELGLTDDVRKVHARDYKPLGRIRHYISYSDTDEHWFLYQTSGDVRYLVDSWKRVCEWFNSHDWLNSAAMPSMDRNPLPRTSLMRARLGALAANRGSSGLVWPNYGLSYVRGADQVAALVTENVPNRLTARLYPFTDAPHPLTLRVWRMDPGRYRVTLFADANDDGAPEEILQTREAALDRGAFVDLTLPPRRCSILRIEPVETRPTDFDLPDAAVSPLDTELVYGEHLVVKVHNIGRKPVENLLVRVRDGRSGRVVVSGEQRIARIDPPLDLKPRVVGVEFKNINAATCGSILVEIDPDRECPDLNRHNNRLELRY